MAGQRTPGIIGIWGDPFPDAEGPWPSGAACPAFPTGPAAGAKSPAGCIGLETPEHLGLIEDGADEEGEAFTVPDRYRHMDVQGVTVKVRCNPRWLVRARQIAQADNLDLNDRAEFLRMIKKRNAKRRAEIASVLCPMFRSQNKSDLADALDRLVKGGNRRRAG